MKKEFLLQVLHIFALSSLAFAQPVFDILGKNPTYFVANRIESGDLLWLVIILCIAIPSTLSLLVFFTRLFSKQTSKITLALEIILLVAAIILPIAKNLIPDFRGEFLIGGTVLFGVVFALFYLRSKTVFSFITALTPAIIAIPILFLFFSAANRIAFPPQQTSKSFEDVDSNIPIVMVIFDEFSLTSLMDASRQIDSARYPGFWNLANKSFWFRNATTVCDLTEKVVPAILTGKRPDTLDIEFPTSSDYPDNLFSLLQGSYRLHTFETITSLNPNTRATPRKSSPQSRKTLTSDLPLIYAHLILPEDMAETLPPIDKTWGSFASTEYPFSPDSSIGLDSILSLPVINPTPHLKERFYRFLQYLENSSEPSLSFIHIDLPHIPYQYLPDGRKYIVNPTRSPEYLIRGEKWDLDEWTIMQSYQRYLLQVGFVDKLMADLVTRLKEIDLFDKCLLVVSADHGVSFLPSDYRRPLSPTNFRDILSVPLFFKLPGQQKGVISDRNVELIDILPTVGDILKIKIPWEMDGSSMIDSLNKPRENKLALNLHQHGVPHVYTSYSPNVFIDNPTLSWQLEHFGSGQRPFGLFRIGDDYGIFNKNVTELPIREDNALQIELNNRTFFESVDTRRPFLLSEVSGMLNPAPVANNQLLAIAINNRISAFTRLVGKNASEFTATIPFQHIKMGYNQIDVFLVEGGKGGPVLVRPKRGGNFSLVTNLTTSREEIAKEGGGRVSVVRGRFEGALELLEYRDNHLFVEGWSADLRQSRLPDQILVFQNNTLIHSGTTSSPERKDVALALKNDKLVHSGFRFEIASPPHWDSATTNIRVFAVYDRVANEVFKPSARILSKTLSERFRLVKMDSDWKIRTPEGKIVGIEAGAIHGNIDVLEVKNKQLIFSGWAADVKRLETISALLVFQNQQIVGCLVTDLDRSDIARSFQSEKLRETGFSGAIDLSSMKHPPRPEQFRFIAYSKHNGLASEIFPPNVKLVEEGRQSNSIEGAYVLRRDSSGLNNILISPQGVSLNLDAARVTGFVDRLAVESNNLIVSGWAAEVQKHRVAKYLVVFGGSDHLATIQVGLDRPDLVRAFGSPAFQSAGFNYHLPLNRFRSVLDLARMRVFAVAQDRKHAAELKLPSNSPHFVIVSLQDSVSVNLQIPWGPSIPVKPGAIDGSVDIFEVKGDSVHVACWALHPENSAPVEAVIIFVNGRSTAIITPETDRPDLEQLYKTKSVRRSGIDTIVPLSTFGSINNTSSVRFFGVSRGGKVAAELKYPSGYSYRH